MTRNQSDAAPDGSAGRDAAERGGAAPLPTAAQVARYLRRHPEFLADHPDVLDVLAPPRRMQGDGVLDLQHFMVQRLRLDLAEAKAAHEDLVATSRGNLAAQNRVHRAVISLMSARSFEHLIDRVTTDLAVMLDLDVVTLGVEKAAADLPPVRLGGICQLAQGTVDAVIGPGRGIALKGDVAGDPGIFGAGAGLVASQALIRLTVSRATPQAMLALGSRQPDQFHQGQGTELLNFLGAALENCIRGWLHLPE